MLPHLVLHGLGTIRPFTWIISRTMVAPPVHEVHAHEYHVHHHRVKAIERIPTSTLLAPPIPTGFAR